jgi:hypothetical protein
MMFTKIKIIFDTTPCHAVNIYRGCREDYCRYFQRPIFFKWSNFLDSEDGDLNRQVDLLGIKTRALCLHRMELRMIL